MQRSYSAFVFLAVLLFHDHTAALNLSPPPDEEAVKTVRLFGSIPARRSVEDFIVQNAVDREKITTLYYKTISDADSKVSQFGYKHLLVGEIDNLTIYVNRVTKEISKIFIDN